MTRYTLLTIPCLVLLLVTAGCSKPGQNSASESTTSPAVSPSQRITSESVVKVVTQPLEISAGGSGEAIVRLNIQSGYHINANPPTYSYLKATELEIPPGGGISVDFIVYPTPIERKLEFAEKPLAVYEGQTELKAQLKADKSAKKGEQSIPARLRIQACDEQVCYAPGTINLALPVSIK